MKNIVHNDCTHNPLAPCRRGNLLCTKQFPKSFCDSTTHSESNYTNYRRRSPEQGGRSVVYGGRVVDNRWIVSYNTILLLKYNCHINIEICS